MRTVNSQGGASRNVRRKAQPRTFEEVVQQVREMITGGALKAGDRLPAERELAVRLGVARPTLREALRLLEGAGLIELRKGKTGGAFISSGRPNVMSENMSDLLRLGSVSIEELFEARLGIQEAVVSLACDRITEAELQALEGNVARAKELDEEGESRKRTETNIQFHSLIAEATRNPVLILIVRGLTDALRYLVQQIGSELPPVSMSARKKLIRALREGDKSTARVALRTILNAAEPMYVKLARQSKNAPAALATHRTWMGESHESRRGASPGTSLKRKVAR